MASDKREVNPNKEKSMLEHLVGEHRFRQLTHGPNPHLYHSFNARPKKKPKDDINLPKTIYEIFKREEEKSFWWSIYYWVTGWWKKRDTTRRSMIELRSNRNFRESDTNNESLLWDSDDIIDEQAFDVKRFEYFEPIEQGKSLNWKGLLRENLKPKANKTPNISNFTKSNLTLSYDAKIPDSRTSSIQKSITVKTLEESIRNFHKSSKMRKFTFNKLNFCQNKWI